jgi:hypothetical protein
MNKIGQVIADIRASLGQKLLRISPLTGLTIGKSLSTIAGIDKKVFSTISPNAYMGFTG